MAALNWPEAKACIAAAVTVGTGMGRAGTSRRKVIAIDHASHRYDYAGERAFQVRIGVDSAETVDVPWSMLERCHRELVAGGYDGKVFRRLYRKQADIHG